MVDNLKQVAKLNDILEQLDEDRLNQLYLRVFNTDDGWLLLQDLANRCSVNTPTMNDRDEGARSVWLSIQTRLYNAVSPKTKGEENE